MNHRTTRVLGGVLTLALGALCGQAQAQDLSDSGQCRNGEYILSASTIPQLRAKAVDAFNVAVMGGTRIKKQSAHTVLVHKDTGISAMAQGDVVPEKVANRMCERLRRMQRDERRVAGTIVRNVECNCNAKLSVSRDPNEKNMDPLHNIYNQQWGMINQDNDVDMDLPQAWDLTTGSSDVVVAVIDTGVDYTHPDLVNNIWTNPGEIPGNGIDDDGNGYVDDVHGINAITGSGDPMDDAGHGTHCAGVIGAQGNNSIGVVGVNWKVKILAAKFLGSDGNGWLNDAIEALDYITLMKTRYGVNIVLSSNSWGGTGETWSQLHSAILRSQNAGMLFVAAAGNAGANMDNTPFSPAGDSLDSIVSVAAIDSSGSLASFSNYGAQTVDIAAPGVHIASTYPGAQYMYMDGTSMATPHVSGLLALAAGYSPQTSWQDLKSKLLSTAKPLSSLSGRTVSGGMADAYRMLSGIVAGPTPTPTRTPVPTSTSTPTPTPTSTPTIAPGNFPVSGRVTVNGQSFAHAAILLTINGQQMERTSADDGSYSFGGILGPVNYTITVRAPGYSWDPQSGFLTQAATLNFDGHANTGFSISGYVLDTNNHPIPGITVDAGSLGSMVSRSDGTFSFSAIYGTQYRLRVIGTDSVSFNFPERVGTVYGNLGRVFVGTVGP